MSAPWIDIAVKELGVTETPGPKTTARILEYFKAADSPVISDETAWCSAFACWVMEKAGLPSTNNLMARSWLRYGKPCEAKPGAIGVLSRGSDPRFGHVVFVVDVFGQTARCVGGNQGTIGKVSYQNYPLSRFVGFRWPNTFMNSGTIKATLLAGAGGSAALLPDVYSLTSDFVTRRQEVDPTSAIATIGGVVVLAIGLWLVVSRRLGKMKAPKSVEEGDDGAE